MSKLNIYGTFEHANEKEKKINKTEINALN